MQYFRSTIRPDLYKISAASYTRHDCEKLNKQMEKKEKKDKVMQLTTHYGAQPLPPASLVVKQGIFDKNHPPEGGLHPQMREWEDTHKFELLSADCGYPECPEYAECGDNPEHICLLGNVDGFVAMVLQRTQKK